MELGFDSEEMGMYEDAAAGVTWLYMLANAVEKKVYMAYLITLVYGIAKRFSINTVKKKSKELLKNFAFFMLSDDEKAQLHKVRKQLGLLSNDELMTVLSGVLHIFDSIDKGKLMELETKAMETFAWFRPMDAVFFRNDGAIFACQALAKTLLKAVTRSPEEGEESDEASEAVSDSASESLDSGSESETEPERIRRLAIKAVSNVLGAADIAYWAARAQDGKLTCPIDTENLECIRLTLLHREFGDPVGSSDAASCCSSSSSAMVPLSPLSMMSPIAVSQEADSSVSFVAATPLSDCAIDVDPQQHFSNACRVAALGDLAVGGADTDGGVRLSFRDDTSTTPNNTSINCSPLREEPPLCDAVSHLGNAAVIAQEQQVGLEDAPRTLASYLDDETLNAHNQVELSNDQQSAEITLDTYLVETPTCSAPRPLASYLGDVTLNAHKQVDLSNDQQSAEITLNTYIGDTLTSSSDAAVIAQEQHVELESAPLTLASYLGDESLNAHNQVELSNDQQIAEITFIAHEQQDELDNTPRTLESYLDDETLNEHVEPSNDQHIPREQQVEQDSDPLAPYLEDSPTCFDDDAHIHAARSSEDPLASPVLKELASYFRDAASRPLLDVTPPRRHDDTIIAPENFNRTEDGNECNVTSSPWSDSTHLGRSPGRTKMDDFAADQQAAKFECEDMLSPLTPVEADDVANHEPGGLEKVERLLSVPTGIVPVDKLNLSDIPPKLQGDCEMESQSDLVSPGLESLVEELESRIPTPSKACNGGPRKTSLQRENTRKTPTTRKKKRQREGTSPSFMKSTKSSASKTRTERRNRAHSPCRMSFGRNSFHSPPAKRSQIKRKAENGLSAATQRVRARRLRHQQEQRLASQVLGEITNVTDERCTSEKPKLRNTKAKQTMKKKQSPKPRWV